MGPAIPLFTAVKRRTAETVPPAPEKVTGEGSFCTESFVAGTALCQVPVQALAPTEFSDIYAVLIMKRLSFSIAQKTRKYHLKQSFPSVLF